MRHNSMAHKANLAALLPEFAADHLGASIVLFNLEAFLLQLQRNAPSQSITDLTTPAAAALLLTHSLTHTFTRLLTHLLTITHMHTQSPTPD